MVVYRLACMKKSGNRLLQCPDFVIHYSGYGESLIDYNFRQTRFGVGIMLNDIL
ncbi:Phospholipase A1 precursor [Edwardsiella tarda]|nr:Phospholipase A1 precursor [Edwardsiella tarda]